MVQVWFPGWSIPELAFGPYTLLDVWLLAVHLHIGWPRVVLLDRTTIWNSFLLFNTDWITIPVTTTLAGMINAVPQAVWNLCKGTLDSWADDFYRRHCSYEDYVRERDGKRKEQ